MPKLLRRNWSPDFDGEHFPPRLDRNALPGALLWETFDEPSAPALELPSRSMFEQAFKNIDDVL